MNEQHKESFQQQAESNVDEAALQIARRIQTPGQSKQQTKLIAQGIAKGIALYRRQQNEKLRDRDKRRKKLARERRDAAAAGPLDAELATPPAARAAGIAVWIVALALSLAAFLHLARWIIALPVTVGTWELPVWWSLPVAVVLGALAVWLILATRSDSRRAP